MLMGYSEEPEVCIVAQATTKEVIKMELDLEVGDSD